MKNYRTLNIFYIVILILNFSELTFAQATIDTKSKHVTKFDSTCDASFLENYEAKHACIFDTNSSACTLLAIGTSVGVGGAAGLTAKKMFDSVLSKLPSDTRKNFLEVAETFKAEKNLRLRVINDYKKLENQKTQEVTQGKFKSFSELKYAAFTTETGPERDLLGKYQRQVDDAAYDEYEKLAKNERDPKLRDAMKHQLDFNPFNWHDDRMKAVKEKIKTLFPKEYEKLNPFYENESAISKAMSELNKKERSFLQKNPEGTISPFSEEKKSLTMQREENQRKLSLVASSTSKVLLVDMLVREGMLSVHGHRTRGMIFNQARSAIKESKEYTGKVASNGTAVITTAATFGAFIANDLMGQADIRSCQSTFDFTPSEIEYLGNKNVFSIAKARKSGSWGCDSLQLVDPANSFQEMQDKFGGVPAGICKLVQQQNKNLDKILGEVSTNPNVSCEKITDTNLAVLKGPSQAIPNSDNKDIFEYRSGSFIYRAPIKDDLNYPDFRFLVAFDENGNEVRNESLRMQKFYSVIHPANVSEPRPDLKDLTSACEENSHNGKLFCNMKQAAARARIARSIRSNLCSTSENGPTKAAKPNEAVQ